MDIEVLSREVDGLRDQLKEVKEQIKETSRDRISDNERFVQQINDMNLNIRLQNQSLQSMLDTQKDFKNSLKSLLDEITSMKEEPAKNWKTVVLCVITSLVGGFSSYFMTKAGLK